VLGGLGLFLIGITTLTDGLKAVAGRSFNALLARFTRGRLSALLSGVVFTALIQSSSATTLAVIGFVNAGLLELGPVVAVIYGANVGTTFTVWLVNLIGFKVKVSMFALPMIGAGAALVVLAKRKARSVGLVLAGFGLLFLGINLMQEGMRGIDAWDVGGLDANLLLGRLALAGLGAIMTVAMQASAAALAITLAALAAGTIGFTEAAALAVGQNLGTTITAVIGAVGGNPNAKRAAAAHVIFNIATGLAVLLAFPLILDAVALLCDAVGITEAPSRLSTFHTFFNVLGVALMTPFIGVQVRWLEKRFVDEAAIDAKPRHLNKNLFDAPQAALAAVDKELEHLTELTDRAVRIAFELDGEPDELKAEAKRYRDAVRGLAVEVARFVERVELPADLQGRAFSQLRTLTHFRSAAAHAVRAQRYRGELMGEEIPDEHLLELIAEIGVALDRLSDPTLDRAERDIALKAALKRSRKLRKKTRRDVLQAVSTRALASSVGMLAADYTNQLERIVYDLARTAHHWRQASAPPGTVDIEVEPETEPELS